MGNNVKALFMVGSKCAKSPQHEGQSSSSASRLPSWGKFVGHVAGGPSDLRPGQSRCRG